LASREISWARKSSILPTGSSCPHPLLSASTCL
jgi:hypothetical protein